MQKIYVVTQSLEHKPSRLLDTKILRVYSKKEIALEFIKALLEGIDNVEVFSEDACWTYEDASLAVWYTEVREYILE